MSTLASLAARKIIQQDLPTDTLPEDARIIVEATKWLQSVTIQWFVPMVYIPLTSKDITLLNAGLDIVLQFNQEIPAYYDFQQRSNERRINGNVAIAPLYLAHRALHLLISCGVQVKRGDIITIPMLANFRTNGMFIVHDVERLIVQDFGGEEPDQGPDFKAVTEFPPRYFYRYEIIRPSQEEVAQYIDEDYWTSSSKCYIDTNLFVDQMIENMEEIGSSNMHDILYRTKISYKYAQWIIDYTIFIHTNRNFGDPRSRENLLTKLGDGNGETKLECTPYLESPNIVHQEFERNPYTTMIYALQYI